MDRDGIIANVTVIDGLGGATVDCFVAVEGGVIREVGSHEDLMREEEGIYRRLHELQYLADSGTQAAD